MKKLSKVLEKCVVHEIEISNRFSNDHFNPHIPLSLFKSH